MEDERMIREVLAAVEAKLREGAPLVVIHAEIGQDARVMTGSPGECRTITCHPRPRKRVVHHGGRAVV